MRVTQETVYCHAILFTADNHSIRLHAFFKPSVKRKFNLCAHKHFICVAATVFAQKPRLSSVYTFTNMRMYGIGLSLFLSRNIGLRQTIDDETKPNVTTSIIISRLLFSLSVLRESEKSESKQTSGVFDKSLSFVAIRVSFKD